MEEALLMENSTGKRGRLKKILLTNAREIEQLKGMLKENV